MTGGWAATNTLRETLNKTAFGTEHTSDLLESEAALALVEAALDAFEEWGYQRRRFIDRETDSVTLMDAEANALAALRAVRVGK